MLSFVFTRIQDVLDIYPLFPSLFISTPRGQNSSVDYYFPPCNCYAYYLGRLNIGDPTGVVCVYFQQAVKLTVQMLRFYVGAIKPRMQQPTCVT